jgi:biotin carboxyl carrier protein
MSSAHNSAPAAAQRSFGGKWIYGVIAVALLFVLMPFLFWQATWFGRPLDDQQLQKALSDKGHPREIQHALSQLEVRIRRGDPAARKWYPQLAVLAGSPVDEIRLTTAWVMGQDNTAPEFHQALLRLVRDPQPMVARNAALSLVRFQDYSGHAQILTMLQPYALPAPVAGTLRTRLKPGDVVNPGTLVAHIDAANGKQEVRTVVPGTIGGWLTPDGTIVSAGQPIVSLAPNEEMAWEALRALYLIGTTADLSSVERYRRAFPQASTQIQKQASLTAQAIRSRSGS